MATENSTEVKKITLPTVPSEDDEKRYRQNKENFIQTKTEIDQTDLDAIERADRENREILIRNIVKQQRVWQLMIKYHFKILCC